MDKNCVVVGMSGGVDSSVAAYLLKQRGFKVIGVTMNLWHESENALNDAITDARKIAEKLGIEHYVIDFKDIFRNNVVDYFIKEYMNGRTPNPCLICNKQIKFGALLAKARELGAYYIATGHYARVERDLKANRFILRKGVDDKKDQTYVLYSLSQYQLEHILMPLGNYTKDKIRNIAHQIGLEVADKPDSQEICFIKDNDYGRFIKKICADDVKEGYFVDVTGKILGKHKGVIYYTIGQRKGLGVSFGKPMYVVDIDAKNNIVVLGEQDDLFNNVLIAYDVNFIAIESLYEPMRVKAKIRYNAKEAGACIYPFDNDKVKVVFDEPQRAITPGQGVVFYKEDKVIGGGIILFGHY